MFSCLVTHNLFFGGAGEGFLLKLSLPIPCIAIFSNTMQSVIVESILYQKMHNLTIYAKKYTIGQFMPKNTQFDNELVPLKIYKVGKD